MSESLLKVVNVPKANEIKFHGLPTPWEIKAVVTGDKENILSYDGEYTSLTEVPSEENSITTLLAQLENSPNVLLQVFVTIDGVAHVFLAETSFLADTNQYSVEGKYDGVANLSVKVKTEEEVVKVINDWVVMYSMPNMPSSDEMTMPSASVDVTIGTYTPSCSTEGCNTGYCCDKSLGICTKCEDE